MRFTASSYRYRRGYSAKNDGGPSYSGSKAQNGYKTTRNLVVLDFVINKIESPLDGISKNVTYKLAPADLPSSPTGDMLTADLEIVTPLSSDCLLYCLDLLCRVVVKSRGLASGCQIS